MKLFPFVWSSCVLMLFLLYVFYSLLAVKFGQRKKSWIVGGLTVRALFLVLVASSLHGFFLLNPYLPVAIIAAAWLLGIVTVFSVKFQSVILPKLWFGRKSFERIDGFFPFVNLVLTVGFVGAFVQSVTFS